jgi:hypothetical protein
LCERIRYSQVVHLVERKPGSNDEPFLGWTLVEVTCRPLQSREVSSRVGCRRRTQDAGAAGVEVEGLADEIGEGLVQVGEASVGQAGLEVEHLIEGTAQVGHERRHHTVHYWSPAFPVR